MEDLLVLVDENDNEIGTGPKLEVHRRKLLHRAFSIFLYDAASDCLLLQQRAFGKYHSGGLWSNSCCSHPRKGESFQEALPRRLQQELGINLTEGPAVIFNRSLQSDPLLFSPDSAVSSVPDADGKKAPFVFMYCGRFRYLADYGDLAEHEIDRVFYLMAEKEHLILRPDPEEIADLQWLPRAVIREKLANEPYYFSAWFGRAFTLVDAGIDRRNV